MDKMIKDLTKRLRPFMAPFLTVAGIYTVAMLSIWRANFSYMDDLARAIEGYAWSDDFNRVSQSWLSYLLNTNFTLVDISPFTQIVAVILLSIASVIVASVFCSGKLKYAPLIMSTFIGLTPFFIGCWVFKFDAPGMALSVLAASVPILFWSKIDKKTTIKEWMMFGSVSFISLLIMWTSYQSASGILPVLVLGLALSDFLKRVKLKEIIRRVLFFGVVFILAALTFKYILPSPDGYHGAEIFSLTELVEGIFKNIKTLAKTLLAALNTTWAIAIILCLLSYLVSLAVFSKRKGFRIFLDVLMGAVFVAVAIPLSFGAFLLLKGPMFGGRFLMGIGVVLAVIGIITCVSATKKWSTSLLAAPGVFLIYSFGIFALAFGNGLADQARYGNFRVEVLLNDLSHIYRTPERVSKTSMHLRGDIGRGPVMQHVYDQYPVVKTIFDKNQHLLADYAWGSVMLMQYNNRPQHRAPGAWLTDVEPIDCDSMDALLNSYYHTIKSDGATVCVIIK